MVTSAPPTPTGGAQTVSSALLQSNSAVLGSQGGSLHPPVNYSSQVLPQTQYQRYSQGNASDIASASNQSLGNGGLNSDIFIWGSQGGSLHPPVNYSSLVLPQTQYQTYSQGNASDVATSSNQFLGNGGLNSDISNWGDFQYGGINTVVETDPRSSLCNAVGFASPHSSFAPSNMANPSSSGQVQNRQILNLSGNQLFLDQQKRAPVPQQQTLCLQQQQQQQSFVETDPRSSVCNAIGFASPHSPFAPSNMANPSSSGQVQNRQILNLSGNQLFLDQQKQAPVPQQQQQPFVETDPRSSICNAIGFASPHSSFAPSNMANPSSSGQVQNRQILNLSGNQLFLDQQKQAPVPLPQQQQQPFVETDPRSSVCNAIGFASPHSSFAPSNMANPSSSGQVQNRQILNLSGNQLFSNQQKQAPVQQQQTLCLQQQQQQQPFVETDPRSSVCNSIGFASPHSSFAPSNVANPSSSGQVQNQQILNLSGNQLLSDQQKQAPVPQQQTLCLQQQQPLKALAQQIPKFAVRPIYQPGTCARRMAEYMYQQKHRPTDNKIEFWRLFVGEFFAPNAKKRLCVSSYGNSRQTNGVFPQETWHCELCKRKPGRGFETTVEVLPRLFKIKYDSGTLEELLNIDIPHEYQDPSSGNIILVYGKAMQESVFEALRVVRDGKLRIVFSPDLKINLWEFCAQNHDELIPRRSIAPQVSQLGAAAQKYQAAAQNAITNSSIQDLKSTSSTFLASANQLQKSMEVPLVNELGYTKRYVRCLQISEVVNIMTDLIGYAQETRMGPIECLAKFPRRSSSSSRLHNTSLQQPEQQQQQIPGQNFNNVDNYAQGASIQLSGGNCVANVNNSHCATSTITPATNTVGLLRQNLNNGDHYAQGASIQLSGGNCVAKVNNSHCATSTITPATNTVGLLRQNSNNGDNYAQGASIQLSRGNCVAKVNNSHCATSTITPATNTVELLRQNLNNGDNYAQGASIQLSGGNCVAKVNNSHCATSTNTVGLLRQNLNNGDNYAQGASIQLSGGNCVANVNNSHCAPSTIIPATNTVGLLRQNYINSVQESPRNNPSSPYAGTPVQMLSTGPSTTPPATQPFPSSLISGLTPSSYNNVHQMSQSIGADPNDADDSNDSLSTFDRILQEVFGGAGSTNG